MKDWLKNSLIWGIILYVVYWILIGISFMLCMGDLSGGFCGLSEALLRIINIKHYLIANSIFYFIIGAIIGFVISKFKKPKEIKRGKSIK